MNNKYRIILFRNKHEELEFYDYVCEHARKAALIDGEVFRNDYEDAKEMYENGFDITPGYITKTLNGDYPLKEVSKGEYKDFIRYGEQISLTTYNLTINKCIHEEEEK